MFYLLIIAGFLFGSCKQPDTTWTENDVTFVRDQVDSTLRQYHADIERGGLLAEIKYLDSTEQFSWFAPGYSGPIGYDSVVTIVRVMAPLFPKIDHTWDSLVIAPVSYREATYLGLVTSLMTDTTGYTDTVRFREEGRVIKYGEHWKLSTGKTEIIK